VIPEYRRGITLVGYDPAYDIRQRRCAVLTVCGLAHDADDADELLAILGLRPHEGRPRETIDVRD
jgi:hypothetical protein